MRCPNCRLDMPSDAVICVQCGRHPFSWLGDPFGTQELPEVRPATAPRPAATRPIRPRGPRAGLTAGKLIPVLLIIWLSTFHSPILAVLVAATFLLLVIFLPPIDTPSFLVLLVLIWVAELIAVPAARSAGSPRRSSAAPLWVTSGEDD